MTERPTYPRSTCCILGCPRWSRRFPGEWMCGRHWKMVSRLCRQGLRKAWQRQRDLRSIRGTPAWTPEDKARWIRTWDVEERLWAHAKRRVTLMEAGL